MEFAGFICKEVGVSWVFDWTKRGFNGIFCWDGTGQLHILYDIKLK